jgi:hypothetical protein
MLTITDSKLTLKIIKTFAPPAGPTSRTSPADPKSPPILKTILVEPMGSPTSHATRITLPVPFTITPGAVLDLSPWYPQLMHSEKMKAELSIFTGD